MKDDEMNMQYAPSPSNSPVTVGLLLAALHDHRTMDKLRTSYAVLILLQVACVTLYYGDLLPQEAALLLGLVTSLLGPAFSLAVGLHTFSHRRASRMRDVATIAITYLITCTSFAIIYVIICDREVHAFTVPGGSATLTFGAAMYFSTITITTTGYGDIAPLSGLARFVTCLEVGAGLAYQVFIFSVAASLLSTAPLSTPPVDK